MEAPPVPRPALPSMVKVVSWIVLVGGGLQFLSGLAAVVMPVEEGTLFAVPFVYVGNVVFTILGGIAAVYAWALLARREWGRRGIVVLLYVTAALSVAAVALLWFQDFGDLSSVRTLRDAGLISKLTPEVLAWLKRATVTLAAVFAAMIVVFHTLVAGYLGRPSVRDVFVDPVTPKSR